MDVGEPVISALESVGQTLVIHAHQVQDGGVQVMDRYRVLRDVVGLVVGGAMRDARLDAPACHPDREATRMMVSPVIGLGELTL